jgi:hypothetical protein
LDLGAFRRQMKLGLDARDRCRAFISLMRTLFFPPIARAIGGKNPMSGEESLLLDEHPIA